MSRLPTDLYTAAQVRQLDRIAIEEAGIPGAVLMERAGRSAFAYLRARWPAARRVAVLCGAGNNGGDGYVVARLARVAGLAATVYAVGAPERLKGDARAQYEAAHAAGVPVTAFAGQPLEGYDLLVDALLGTGLSGAVAGVWGEAIGALNGVDVPVLAVDIPSGLAADSGRVLGVAVRCAVTVTFIGLKQGLFTGAGPAYSGEVLFDDLGVPASVYTRVAPAARRLDADLLKGLPRRSRDAHKGDHGHVLVVGGDHGTAGAARMAAEAALRCGAGLVSVATRAANAAALTAARPELMCRAVEGAAELEPLLARADVVAVGPGLGTGEWGRGLLERVLAADRPLVVDADALNLLADTPRRRDDWVLTPHPGEAGRLLGSAVGAVQTERFAALVSLGERYGGVCVLKGAGTLVGGPGAPPAVCAAGNPGMGSGGMGDLLTGVIAALIAQGLSLRRATELGVCLHAGAGDAAAAEGGERGMIASDLYPHLRRLANPHR